MKPEDVAGYLQQHPEFFNEYAEILADIHIPSPHDERVISIHERQVLSLRERNHILQNKLLELISFGEENDSISEKMHRLVIALLSVSDLDELFTTLYFSLKEDFTVPLVTVRFWNLSCDGNLREEFGDTSEDVHTIAESLSQPYCGNHVADEIRQWFGESACHLNSFAMIPLRATRSIGLLVLGSPDATRFYPEMGTLHLKRLGELVSTAVTRHDEINALSASVIDDDTTSEQQT